MSYELPTPPASLPTDLVNQLNESSPERLHDVATYAEELAEHKEREARLEEEADQNAVEERPDDQTTRRPDDQTTDRTTFPKGDDHDQEKQRQPLLLLAVA